MRARKYLQHTLVLLGELLEFLLRFEVDHLHTVLVSIFNTYVQSVKDTRTTSKNSSEDGRPLAIDCCRKTVYFPLPVSVPAS